MNPELAQNLTVAGIVALVGAVWRLGNKVAIQNGAVASLMKEMAEHKVEDRQSFMRIFDRLEQRRRWWTRS